LILFRFYGTCFLCGLLALPLSGAGLTFFAAAKKVSKESSFFRQQSPHAKALAQLTGPAPKCRPQWTSAAWRAHALTPLAIQQSGKHLVQFRPRFARTKGKSKPSVRRRSGHINEERQASPTRPMHLMSERSEDGCMNAVPVSLLCDDTLRAAHQAPTVP
jgi:hypothetical protein